MMLQTYKDSIGKIIWTWEDQANVCFILENKEN